MSTTFATSTELVRQDPDRGWAIKLRVAATFDDSDGIDAQPVLERLTFRLPEATVNAGGVTTCSARPRIYVAFNDNVCAEAGAKPVGIGTSDVQLRRPKNINLFGNPPFETYHLRLGMFIGPAVKGASKDLLLIRSSSDIAPPRSPTLIETRRIACSSDTRSPTAPHILSHCTHRILSRNSS